MAHLFLGFSEFYHPSCSTSKELRHITSVLAHHWSKDNLPATWTALEEKGTHRKQGTHPYLYSEYSCLLETANQFQPRLGFLFQISVRFEKVHHLLKSRFDRGPVKLGAEPGAHIVASTMHTWKDMNGKHFSYQTSLSAEGLPNHLENTCETPCGGREGDPGQEMVPQSAAPSIDTAEAPTTKATGLQSDSVDDAGEQHPAFI